MDFVVPLQLIKTWLELGCDLHKILTFFITRLKPNYKIDNKDVSMIWLMLQRHSICALIRRWSTI